MCYFFFNLFVLFLLGEEIIELIRVIYTVRYVYGTLGMKSILSQ